MSSSVKVRMAQGKSFRVAAIQLGGTTPSKKENLERASKLFRKAVSEKEKPDLVVLPECFNSPYGHDHFPNYCEEIHFKSGTPYNVQSSPSESVQLLSSLAKEAGVWLVGGSIPEKDGDKLYNTATVYNRSGDLIAIHRKLHLFDIDIPGGITFKESTTLTGGDKVTTFDTEFGKLGLGICYDLRFPEMAMIASRQGAIAMIYPGAFNTTTGPIYWELLQRARAVDNQIYVVTASPARPESGYPSYGHSMVVDPTYRHPSGLHKHAHMLNRGKVVATTDEKESIVHASIDIDLINKTRQNIPLSIQRRFDVYTQI